MIMILYAFHQPHAAPYAYAYGPVDADLHMLRTTFFAEYPPLAPFPEFKNDEPWEIWSEEWQHWIEHVKEPHLEWLKTVVDTPPNDRREEVEECFVDWLVQRHGWKHTYYPESVCMDRELTWDGYEQP